MPPLDVVAPVTQQYVDWRLRNERRRGDGMARRSPAATRRWLTARTRRYLRRRERWEATMRLPNHPASREAKQFSQNGEDGIIAAICEQIGVHDGVFVEIGASDGEENCTRALAERGWRGVWIEGDAGRAAHARTIGASRAVITINAFVDRDNVVALVDGTDVVAHSGIDVLVIDVDGNDWYLWRELAHRHRPSLVVTEVNGALGPWIDWVMPYDPEHEWHDDRNHGATLRAWNRLATEFGYVLVACDGNGVNAFWVRRDHAAGFPAAGRVLRQYAPPAHDPPLGHPWFAPPPPANTALTLDELARIRLERPTFARARRAGRANAVIVDIVNGSPHPIASVGANPVKITARWGTNPSSTEWTEPQRGLIAGTIAPGERGAGVVMLGAQTESFATLDVVQEGVAWAHDAPAWEPVRAE